MNAFGLSAIAYIGLMRAAQSTAREPATAAAE